ncbi:hypothetical protein KQX54_021409 [Cotesia glomerata]|uniref:Uncharacterized protein n=1 Tax=Cotesia glomerata TaxID=32391 RepID=A0AAV7JAG5_COTGL|nr:hypothetical protein KQX54_021409 [Cotesia glomerata]
MRPPSSSLSYPGAGANDDARSPGSGGTPGPLSQQAPTSLDSSDPVWRSAAVNTILSDESLSLGAFPQGFTIYWCGGGKPPLSSRPSKEQPIQLYSDFNITGGVRKECKKLRFKRVVFAWDEIALRHFRGSVWVFRENLRIFGVYSERERDKE